MHSCTTSIEREAFEHQFSKNLQHYATPYNKDNFARNQHHSLLQLSQPVLIIQYKRLQQQTPPKYNFLHTGESTF